MKISEQRSSMLHGVLLITKHFIKYSSLHFHDARVIIPVVELGTGTLMFLALLQIPRESVPLMPTVIEQTSKTQAKKLSLPS
jgi:hypothetical protein